MVIVAASLFWGIQKLSTKAEVSDFFPLTCLGNWQNPANAQGKPETLGGVASSTALTAANSSVFDPGASSSQIFCGSFIPADYKTQGDIKNIGLTLIWKIPSFSSSTGAATLDVTTTTVATTTQPAHTNASTTDVAPATTTPATTTVHVATGTSENIFLKYFSLMFNVAFADVTSTAGMPASTTPLAPTSTSSQTTAPPPVATTSVPSSTVATTTTSTTSTTIITSASTTPTSTITATTTLGAASATAAPSSTVIIAPPIIATLSPIASTTATGTGAVGTGTKTLPANANATATVPATLLAPPPPDNNFLKVSYSLDGQTWVELSKVNPDNWQNFTATLPIVSWDDMKKLQIKIEGIPTALRLVPQVYLDGMFVEVHYEIPPPIPLLN